jgi:hypothetical protein
MTPGYKWRLLAHGQRPNKIAGPLSIESGGATQFDELVVDDWLHIEQMDTRVWWMRVGETTFDIRIDRKGQARITLTEGPVEGLTGGCQACHGTGAVLNYAGAPIECPACKREGAKG